jgi:hypothetical protein
MVRIYYSVLKPLTNLRLSSLGLPKSFQQDCNYVALHYRIQAVWIQCVYLATSNPPAPVIYRPTPSATAASFMNTVILTSVISAGNHALFAGTRVLYGLAAASHAPPLFAWTTRGGVPLPALLLTSSISALCFGSSFIENGQLWAWLQNLVGVSNQVRYITLRFVFTCFSLSLTRVDCLVVHWYRVVEIQESVEDARQAVIGDEVSRAVDVAVGPSFRGACAFPPTLLRVSLTRFLASHRIAP